MIDTFQMMQPSTSCGEAAVAAKNTRPSIMDGYTVGGEKWCVSEILVETLHPSRVERLTFVVAQKAVCFLECNACVPIFDFVRNIYHIEHHANIAGCCDGEDERVGARQRGAHFTLCAVRCRRGLHFSDWIERPLMLTVVRGCFSFAPRSTDARNLASKDDDDSAAGCRS